MHCVTSTIGDNYIVYEANTAIFMNLPSLQYDECPPRLPQGECRFHFPELSLGASTGRRCACKKFNLNKVVPGSICQCGHQAGCHISSAQEAVVSKDQYDNLLRRLEQTETALECMKQRETQEHNEMRHAVHGLYDNLSSISAQLNTRMIGQGNEWKGVANRVHELQESTRAMQKQFLSLDDSRSDLEVRMNALEVDSMASKQKMKEVGAARTSLSRRASQKHNQKAQTWSCRVLFVPHRLVRDPLDVSGSSHRRCCSRGLLRTLAFDGPDKGSFTSAVDSAFSFVIKGRPWTPFIVTLSSLGGLRPSWSLSPIDGKERAKDWNRAFLERYCVQKGRQGSTPTIVIGLRDEELSWEDVRALPSSQAEDESLWQQDSSNEVEPQSNQSRLSRRSGSRSSVNEARSSANPSPGSSLHSWVKEEHFSIKRRRKSSDDTGSGFSV